MTDLSEGLYRQARLVLEGHLADLERSTWLVGAQRTALQSGNLELLASLSTEGAHLARRLEGTARRLNVLEDPLREARGPRASSIRQLLHRLAIESDRGHARVRQFTEDALAARKVLVNEIRSLDGPSKVRPGRTFRPLSPLPAFLDRSG
ncbi:MAG TPA: hypothetical protein VMG41_09875 [Gemmatimonadales bacterium]|nr:hypothetical protein [Gemmatimonadales bacterium]